MKILLYHFGYYGDIIVVGQNFARELKLRYPICDLHLMVRPRIDKLDNILEPLNLFKKIHFGEKSDYHNLKDKFDRSYIIDEYVYPEGNLRTIFSKSGYPFRQHKLFLKFTESQIKVAKKVIEGMANPIITSQDDMHRKWNQKNVELLHENLQKHGNLVILGENVIHPTVGRPLTFLESCAVAHLSDLFVGIDSGIAHGAALSGTQTALIPPLIPEYFISPTEYANPFIENDHEKHVSIRPNPEDFCGNYLCLKGTKRNAIQKPIGNPLKVKCIWGNNIFQFRKPSCFTKISVEIFYEKVKSILINRKLN